VSSKPQRLPVRDARQARRADGHGDNELFEKLGRNDPAPAELRREAVDAMDADMRTTINLDEQLTEYARRCVPQLVTAPCHSLSQLGQELLDLVSTHSEWPSAEVPGFAETLAWPESVFFEPPASRSVAPGRLSIQTRSMHHVMYHWCIT
jgi:hypothetical protein